MNINLQKLFNGEKKKLAAASIAFLFAGLLADFITTIIWWTRIHPWYGYSKGTSRTTENATISCWIFSLIGLIVLIAYILIGLLVKQLFAKISNGLVGRFCCIAIGCISICSIISGIVASSFALKNDKITQWDEFTEKYDIKKCKCYCDFLFGDGDWWWDFIKENNYMDKYQKWLDTVFDKAVYDDVNDKMVYTNYLCADVGAPTLVFAIIQLIGLIIFIVASYLTNKEGNDVSSKNENDDNS